MINLKSNGSSNPSSNNSSGQGSNNNSSSGETEEINTKDLAQRISAELKRYSIPQAIFAQRVLCRSQGTLSDLLRNPKPWSKLKSGRETFRRMQKWLSEPEFQRMSSLRLAGRNKTSLIPISSRYDLSETFDTTFFDTDTILILSFAASLIPILILIQDSWKIRY